MPVTLSIRMGVGKQIIRAKLATLIPSTASNPTIAPELKDSKLSPRKAMGKIRDPFVTNNNMKTMMQEFRSDSSRYSKLSLGGMYRARAVRRNHRMTATAVPCLRKLDITSASSVPGGLRPIRAPRSGILEGTLSSGACSVLEASSGSCKPFFTSSSLGRHMVDSIPKGKILLHELLPQCRNGGDTSIGKQTVGVGGRLPEDHGELSWSVAKHSQNHES